MGKKKPAPPPPIDYQAQAQAQGQANTQAAQQTAVLSNPNIYGPYGNQTVSYDATGPNGAMQPTIRQTLNPDAQAAVDAQQRVQMQQAQLGSDAMTRAQSIVNQPFQYSGPDIQTSFNTGPNVQTGLGDYGQVQNNFDYGQAQTGLGDYGQVQNSFNGYGNILNDLDLSGIANMPINAGTTAQAAIMSRLNPQLKADEAAQQARLANQGLTAGGEGYNREQNLFDQNKNDLYTQAGAVGLNLDMLANQQGFNQRLQQGGFHNAAQAQGFGQNQAQGEFANAAQNQRYNQALGAGNFYNQGIGQNYQQNMGAAAFGNEAQNQRYNQALGAGGFYNQGLAQQFNQNQAAAQFGNSAGDQSLQRQLALRNQPLNEISALMAGSQVQQPQFQQYTGSTINAAPIFDASKAQGQYQSDIYGQQMSGYNAGMQALGQVAAAPFGMFSFGGK